MGKKGLGPNIPFFHLHYPASGEQMTHREGCKGRVVQPINRNTYEPTGRTFCMECGRLVGKKAFRQMEALMRQGVLTWTNLGTWNHGPTNLRSFMQMPKNEEACDPVAREVIEIQVPRKVAKKLRRMGNDNIEDMLREAANGAFDAVSEAFADPPPAEHVIKKGDVTVAIPHGHLSFPALCDLESAIDMIFEDDPELQHRIAHLVRRAEERTQQEREEGCAPPAPWPGPGHPLADEPTIQETPPGGQPGLVDMPPVFGHQPGPVAQEMKKKKRTKRALRRKVRRRKTY